MTVTNDGSDESSRAPIKTTPSWSNLQPNGLSVKSITVIDHFVTHEDVVKPFKGFDTSPLMV